MVSGSPDVFAYIDDFDCPEGQLPGGGHGEEPDAGCVYLGSRYGYGQNMVLTVDSKLTTANLTGALVVESGDGHGGPASSRPPGRPGLPPKLLPADDLVAWFRHVYDQVKAERCTPPSAARIYGHVMLAACEVVAAGSPHLRSLSGRLNGLAPMTAPVGVPVVRFGPCSGQPLGGRGSPSGPGSGRSSRRRRLPRHLGPALHPT